MKLGFGNLHWGWFCCKKKGYQSDNLLIIYKNQCYCLVSVNGSSGASVGVKITWLQLRCS